MTWFLIIGALMVTIPSEEVCKKMQAGVPGSECKAFHAINLAPVSSGFITIPDIINSLNGPTYFENNISR